MLIPLCPYLSSHRRSCSGCCLADLEGAQGQVLATISGHCVRDLSTPVPIWLVDSHQWTSYLGVGPGRVPRFHPERILRRLTDQTLLSIQNSCVTWPIPLQGCAVWNPWWAISGWWFGTCFIGFTYISYIGLLIIQLTHIFSEGLILTNHFFLKKHPAKHQFYIIKTTLEKRPCKTGLVNLEPAAWLTWTRFCTRRRTPWRNTSMRWL